MTKVVFNGVNLTKHFIVGNLSRPLPEFRDTSSTVDGRDGDVFDGLTLGPREISFEVVCRDKSSKGIQDAARTLMGVFAARKPSALTISDELDGEGNQLVRYAVPTGVFDQQEFIRAGKWTCRLRQHDPYLYGKKRSVTIAAGKTTVVDAGGNSPTWPAATAVVSSGSYYQLRIVGGKGIRYAASFSGQKMNIDMESQIARPTPAISGADGLQKGSRFFALKGNTKLLATHATTLTWRERWM